jgi:F420H(2)-dependent quinone reductase
MASKEHTHGLPLAVRLIATVLPVFSKIHLLVYRRTGGAIGGRLSGNQVLLLTTIGRKTGQERTTPMAYLTDGDALMITGGAGGAEKHPTWWLNLQANPDAQVQVGRRTLRMKATEATQEEQHRLWSRYPTQKALFDSLQQSISRKIPVVVLRPIT